jgi:mannose/cellobiose epimerase-like protein (N-acyl-D-glucosamine 2-epimerase family)
VAFHITGDPKYLEWMRAGVTYIRENAVDREGGGMRTEREANGEWGPQREYRDTQQLAYGLLGMSFYYYLTRDPEVLEDILAIKKYIFTNYYNPSLDALQWMLASNDSARYDEKHLTAQLDQMNAYLVLLTPILPEPERSEWKQSLEQLSRIMMKQFYSPQQNVMFLTATRPEDTDITKTGTDFGHTIKAMWMIRMAGLLTGKKDLIDFSEQNGPRVLERAYLPESGSWAEGLFPGAVVDRDKSWWIYAELDQYAASLAMTNPETSVYLPRTYDYWRTYFVDRTNGEVWNGVYDGSNLPQLGMPKSWPWKNAYHSFEHALVAYITTSQLKGRPVLLFYAFPSLPGEGELRPYFYSGKVISAEPAGDPGYSTWAVRFEDVH